MIVVNEGKNDLIWRGGNGSTSSRSRQRLHRRRIIGDFSHKKGTLKCKIIAKQSRVWPCRVLAAIYAAIAPSHIPPFVSLPALFRFSVTHDPQSTVVIMRT